MTKQTGLLSDDPYGGRGPTAHERCAGQPWDASYRDGPAPWDIGAPQPAVVGLADAGVLRGVVLDAGCGTGDNALYLAAHGPRVLGIDVAETAVSIARERAATRELDVEFIVGDALQLSRLGRLFDTVLDCALFHALDHDEREQYVAGLEAVTRPGAWLYLLCFSDEDPETAGPHPVSRDELAAPFIKQGSGWSITSVSRERLLARFAPEGVPAWLARIERLQQTA